MIGKSAFLLPTVAAVALAVAAGCHASPAGHGDAAAVPELGAKKAEHLPGLHNVVTYAQNVVGGGQPEGAEGLRTLAAMGIKTVVSVDGAAPDVALAEELGMRYVHLPISYDTVTPARQKELAQALASCDGPIYMHCHHGKHRSAAALGSALVLCGTLTPDQAKERMAVSGLAKDYSGLWQAVAEAKPATRSELRVDPAVFPSVAKVSGMVGTMAEIDMVIDLVKQAHQAGWKPPGDHPDLVPAKETARLASLFANLSEDAESKALPGDYQQMLQKSIDASRALDAAVRANDAAAAEKQLTALNKGCKECHVVYRDK
jgi:protein tyrosine phosphatase (PTP) superfamily phosphohydrolase (DUF442 family)